MRLILSQREIACRAIIFDKDGTLVDLAALSLSTGRARATAIAELLGPETAAAWQQAVGLDLARGWLDPDAPLSVAPRREELLVAAGLFYRLGHPWSRARALAQLAYDRADQLLHSPFGAQLLPGVAEALAALAGQGLLLAVATSDRHWRTEAALTALGVAGHFKALVGADDVANGKPAPDMVELACQQLGCPPDKAIVVGDNPVDLEMGRAAGVAAAIGVSSGLNDAARLAELADAVLPSVAALPPLFA